MICYQLLLLLRQNQQALDKHNNSAHLNACVESIKRWLAEPVTVSIVKNIVKD